MLRLLALTLCAGLLAGPAFAKVFQLPEANPAVTVTLPNSWKPTAIDNGAEATSPDGDAYIALETATAKNMEALIDDDIAFLKKNKVKLDLSSKQVQDTTVNGIPVSFIRWSGTDEDGPTNVTLGIFGVTDNLVMLMTTWATPASEKKYNDDFDSTVGSVRRMK